MKHVMIAAVMAALCVTAVPLSGGEPSRKCPLESKDVARSESMTVEGRLLCMHCNLQKEKSCRKVLQIAGLGDELIDVCPSSEVDLEMIAEEGEANLRMTGKMVVAKDGSRMMVIDRAEKIRNRS